MKDEQSNALDIGASFQRSGLAELLKASGLEIQRIIIMSRRHCRPYYTAQKNLRPVRNSCASWLIIPMTGSIGFYPTAAWNTAHL